MTTPLGLRASATAAAVRGGISRFNESPLMNRSGRPMILARLPDEALPPLGRELMPQHSLTSRQIRMLRLGTHAVAEAASALPGENEVPLLLAGPEPYPGEPPAVEAAFIAQLAQQVGSKLTVARSTVHPSGRAGGLEVLAAAVDLIHRRGLSHVLVGGVDSFVDAGLLGLLDRDGRVHAEDVVDGFVPGEGAGFLLLSSRRVLPTSTAVGFISTPGIAQESGHRYSEQPYLGDGLSNAVRAAVQGASGLPIRTVFASFNGESFGAKEWGVAFIRNREAFHPEVRVEHPADCFGDLGAAVGPVLVGLAAIGLKKGYLPGPCLIWCASEGSPRAAVLVSSEPV
jgi:3-oxoacyl-[acyl-carrier-protein] synthase-1